MKWRAVAHALVRAASTLVSMPGGGHGGRAGFRRLSRTHGTLFELVRHFLARMLDGEWSSLPGQWQNVVIGAFALLLPASMLLVPTSSLPGPWNAGRVPRAPDMLADRLALLTLVFAIVGLIALVQWQNLFPGRRDYLALAGLPIRSRQIFLARFLTVLLFSTALVLVVNLMPTAGAALGVHARHSVAAQALASAAGCFFILFAMVALQGLLLNVLPARWFVRISVYVQGLLIGVFLLAALYSWSIRDWTAATLGRLPDFAWAPPVWFIGLDQRLAGDPDPFFGRMADRALAAFAAAAVLMLLTYLLSYRRYRALLVETPVQVAPPRRRSWTPLRLFAGNPRQAAILDFLAKTLARSRAHRTIWLAYIGAAVAVVFNSSLINGEVLRRADNRGILDVMARRSQTLQFLVLFWPLATSVILLPGIRHVLSIPAELPANWIFRLNESQGRRDWMRAVERFVLLYAIAPIYVILAPLAVRSLGFPLALRMTVLQVLVSLILFEVLFQSWQQLPFTCSYTPGKRPLIATASAYLIALAVAVPALSLIIRSVSQFHGMFLFYTPFFVALWIYARRGRLDGWGEARLIYEDTAGLPDLGIRDISFGAAPVPIAARPPTPTWIDTAEAAPMLHAPARGPRDFLASLGQDIRYGVRVLAASPGFTSVALISLTLGIGVATSAFSEMNGFVLRDVPGLYQPEALVLLEKPVSFPDYQRYRRHDDLFASTMAYIAPVPFGVSLGGRTERTWGHLVTASYFPTLGIRPSLGRFFTAQDEQPGRAPAVIVSHQFWRDHLGSDPSVVGRTLRINGQPCAVIGVGPADFAGASPMTYVADLWLPISVPATLASELADNALQQHDRAIFHAEARLRPGVATDRAEAALDATARQIERDWGERNAEQIRRRVTLLPGGKLMPIRKEGMPFLTGFFTLLGGMILLIAASNVANMMLARAADRRKEIAVRLALGAPRWRLLRQLLTECMLIAAAAGVLGFVMAYWLMHAASQIKLPVPVPLTYNLEPDGRVLAFTIALTFFTAFAFGLLPALQATRTDVTPALKEGGNIQLPRFRRLSLRNFLMVSQVAGSLCLLLITGFLVIGHRRMMGGDAGFEPRHVALLSVDPIRDGYTGRQAALFLPKLVERVQALPAVVSATLADKTPMETVGRPGVNFYVGPAEAKVISSARLFEVGRDYFATLGIPILRGRGFLPQDETDESTAVIVNERVVRNCWPGQDPLGRRVELGTEDVPTFSFYGGRKTGMGPRVTGRRRVGVVVGVVRNIRDGVDMSAKELPPIIYLPLRAADMARPSLQAWTLVIRARPGADAMGAVRREIAAMDDRLTPFRARTLEEQMDTILSAIRAALWTYGCIGIFGLILASVGLAGVTAYSVTRRRREIGIRMALGASRLDVLGLVMREGAVMVLIGSAIGFAGARAGTRMLASLMSDVARSTGASSADPVLVAGAPLLLALLALVCCYLPARRSTRIDPALTLRQE